VASPGHPNDAADGTSEPSRQSDLDILRVLSSFIKPLGPEEQERQRRTFSEGAYLTRETLILAMLEVDAGWA
jgi:hypothetical protein